MEFLDGEVVNIFNDNNSSLQKWPTANYVAVSGLDIDSKQNLWVVNSGAPNPLSVKSPGGEWTSFSLGSALSGSDFGNLLIDSYNQKWITLRTDNKLAVFFDNNTLDDPSDDVAKILTNAAGNGALPGNKIYCVAQDRDDEIWLGSDEGVGVIYSPFNLFTGGNFDAQRILVEVGGYTQYLLESEIVTAIAIDGDNRKWMGTDRAGVFLLSEDGTEQIHHFTEENSPLYSNRILAIEINNKTGEVFFGTDKGIISYKDTATEPNPTNDDVVVYPNPVREGYAGLIAIKGLVDNADIKITDVAGTLIYATRAEGGQAIWSGYNFDGRKASTGVYLVFASDDQGNEKMVTKILFIN
jgi:ligand-binding sensor domain-containing protein